MKYGKKDAGKAKGFPMLEGRKDIKDMDRNVADSTGKTAFGKEEHGIEEADWPKKFVVDGGLKYDFGKEAHGVEHDISEIDERAEVDGEEDAPGRTHAYDKTAGKIKSWPKKFRTDGECNDFESCGE
jgi:hypothetical protein